MIIYVGKLELSVSLRLFSGMKWKKIHSIEIKEIKHLKKSNIIEKNKNKLFEELKNIEKNNVKICKYCNKDFTLLADLKRHFMIDCFCNYIQNNETEKNLKSTILDSSMTGTTNTLYNNSDTYNNINHNNTTNNNNNNNNINIIIDPTKTTLTPIPFDDDWDISKITRRDKSSIMISQFMYTELLEEILKMI